MTPTAPTFDLYTLPEGTKPVIFAKDQPEYNPLHAYLCPDGRVVTCWKPDEAELAALLAGEPVVIEVLTFGHPLQPLLVRVG